MVEKYATKEYSVILLLGCQIWNAWHDHANNDCLLSWRKRVGRCNSYIHQPISFPRNPIKCATISYPMAPILNQRFFQTVRLFACASQQPLITHLLPGWWSAYNANWKCSSCCMSTASTGLITDWSGNLQTWNWRLCVHACLRLIYSSAARRILEAHITTHTGWCKGLTASTLTSRPHVSPNHHLTSSTLIMRYVPTSFCDATRYPVHFSVRIVVPTKCFHENCKVHTFIQLPTIGACG